MKHTATASIVVAILTVLLLATTASSPAQGVRDGFNRPPTTDLTGSGKWRKVLDLTDPAASMQVNGDSTISPYNPLGFPYRGAVYWDSALSGRFQVGIVLKHKSGGNNLPVFHLHLMNDSSWFTGNGYGLRFQENSGTDRYDIQRLTGSGTDTPFVALLATAVQECSAGDTLVFKFYQDGRKTAVRYGASGARDSVSVVDTVYRPAAWHAWVQARVFPDSVKLDDFFILPLPYTITASAGAGGSISPAGDVAVDPGDERTFTVTADPGFLVSDVLVDAVSVGATPSYTFTGVGADHTIEAVFDTLRHEIVATASAHGTIAPEGAVSVNHGGDVSFSFLPDPGCHLDSLLVDGAPVDSSASFTFHGVTAGHTIAAYFSLNSYTITATAGPGGTISPSGSVGVLHGGALSFIIAPDPGHAVDTVFVDDVPVDSTMGYTFTNVTGPHAIEATFRDDGLDSVSVDFSRGWNIVSLPVFPADRSASSLFPDAAGGAYGYSGGYSSADTLAPGKGYWVRFNAPDSTVMFGAELAAETVDVAEGWNMVGSISTPLPVSGILTVPPGLTGSGFFGYSGSYVLRSELEPGMGYWVKMAAAGKLVLAAGIPPSHPGTMRILPGAEAPPPPPAGTPSSPAEPLPTIFRLGQNYPNPFNPTTKIEYDLPFAADVRLSVYDVLGKDVARLVEGPIEAGRHSVDFDGRHLPSGIYFCRLTADQHSASMKMLLLK